MSITTETVPDIDTDVLHEIEEKVVTGVTLADLIRKGAQDSKHSVGWGSAGSACALGAAGRAAKDLGII